MAAENEEPGFIEFDTLKALIAQNNSRLKMVDATYGAVPFGEQASESFKNSHIHNAVYFDIDEIADMNAPLAHTMPSPEKFSSAMVEMGIQNDDMVVIYDQNGICMAACRAWWMFHTFGHNQTFVLNGGLPAWLRNGQPVSSETKDTASTETYTVAKYKPDAITHTQDIFNIIDGKKDALIIDARAESRFGEKAYDFGCGTDIGHIPGSINLPFTRLVDPQTGKMYPPAQLRNIFESIIPSPAYSGNIVFTCGSGVTACILSLAAFNAGFDIDKLSVYDGSWTEWSRG